MSKEYFCLTDTIEWTSVEDELPLDGFPVLFWITNKTVDNSSGCYVGWYSHSYHDGNSYGRWFDIYGHSIYSGVTHWSPFPKGPDCTLKVGLGIQDH